MDSFQSVPPGTSPADAVDVSRSKADVCVLIPTFNEADVIAETAELWRQCLDGLALNYRILVVDDGSTDQTIEILHGLNLGEKLVIIAAPHRGNGPTLLDGYRRAAALADFVMQADADSEISPREFAALWHARGENAACFGWRQGRKQTLLRALLSRCSHGAVRVRCGPAVQDVNVPFRLIPSKILEPTLEFISPLTFAPNVVLSGLLAGSGVAIRNCAVPLDPITARTTHFRGLRFAACCLRALAETLWQLRPTRLRALQQRLAAVRGQ